MPRPDLYDHPKFNRLCFILKMPRPHVLGHLEFLWRVGYASGNPVIGDSLDVEIAAEWTGDVGALTKALLEVKLIDESKHGKLLRFKIHDLHDNAPDYVQARYRMNNWRKSRKRRSLDSDKNPQVLRNSSEQLRNGYGTPSPTPAPTPTPTPSSGGVGGGIGTQPKKKGIPPREVTNP